MKKVKTFIAIEDFEAFVNSVNIETIQIDIKTVDANILYPQGFLAIVFYVEKNYDPITENKWQPIETAPKDGTEILCFVESKTKNDVRIASFFGDDWVCNEWVIEPTHWLPVPNPPIMKREGK
jgi:hypothetical protein